MPRSWPLRHRIGDRGTRIFGTETFGKLVVPADDERLAGYGETAEQPGQMLAQMARQLQQPGAPDPQAVAGAI